MDTYTCWCGCLCFQDVPWGPPLFRWLDRRIHQVLSPYVVTSLAALLQEAGRPDKKNFMVGYGIYKYGIYGSILVYECIYIWVAVYI